LTRAGEVVVEHGVTINGTINLASKVPHHASQMYARNISAFLLHVFKGGAAAIDRDDPIVRETMLTWGGDLVNARVREFCSLPPLRETAAGR
jgi:NAD(P) transhydrogenase subunit alpha